MYHGMVVLPWDTILCIVECCSLESRYVIMMCCKALSNIDWSRFCERYGLPERTKYALRQLITRDYCVNWSLSRRQNFVWCQHSNRALFVWTPRTKLWCYGPSFTSLYFKEYRFVDFIRHVSMAFKLLTPCVKRYKCDTCISVQIWKTQKPKTFLNVNGHRKNRSSWDLCFKKKNMQWVRALLEFGIVESRLKLRVRNLEFFV